MGNLLQTLLKLVQSLFGGGKQSQPTTPEADCTVYNNEIPSTIDLDSLPRYQASAAAQAVTDVSAQGVNISCQIQIRPSLGFVHVRVGPRLEFPSIALAEGGTVFELQGASEADPDGYRWYTIKTPDGTGWVRGDTVIIGDDCLPFTFITEDDLTPPDPITPTPTTRFALPSDERINFGYTTQHRAYDLDTKMGTPIPAATTGLVIRRVDCTACDEGAKPNRYPCPNFAIESEEWGYGYGNFVVVRHAYHAMPPPMRDYMNNNNLGGGFVYILYAHFSENHVNLGDIVQAGQILGLSGNHGCSSGEHLHIEIRMGRDEIVDGHWLDQKPVHPNLVFET